ncbi:hypothetical protein B0H14DRAFT_2629789 [Mycena olivaceomarginata]|nr:hypothetical protein B0H14DRAFT_2629789 [Mycena olivaceomarginata]
MSWSQYGVAVGHCPAVLGDIHVVSTNKMSWWTVPANIYFSIYLILWVECRLGTSGAKALPDGIPPLWWENISSAPFRPADCTLDSPFGCECQSPRTAQSQARFWSPSLPLAAAIRKSERCGSGFQARKGTKLRGQDRRGRVAKRRT